MLVNWTCCNSKREREGGRKTEKVWVIPTKRQSANVPGYVQNDTTCTRAHTTGFAWRTERDGTRERERERERQKFAQTFYRLFSFVVGRREFELYFTTGFPLVKLTKLEEYWLRNARS